VGILPLADALGLADERGLDLVEVAPNSEPSVCRLLDYGKFRYLQTKREKEAKKSQHITMLRQVRFRPNIGQHDRLAKERVVRKLLGEGAKVKLSVRFRGREMAHPELGMSLLKHVTEALTDDAKLEVAPNMEGRMMSIVLAPVASRVAKKPAAVDGELAKEIDIAEVEDS
jgi:translation initiation factor IF-3